MVLNLSIIILIISTVKMLWAGHPRNHNLTAGRGKRFFSFPKCPHQCQATSSILFRFFPRVKCQGLEAVSSFLCHANVKDEWSYASAPIACLCGRYKDNCTLSWIFNIYCFKAEKSFVYIVKCFFFLLCLKRTIICSMFLFWILLRRSSSDIVYFHFFLSVLFPLLKKVWPTVLNIITGISYCWKVWQCHCCDSPLELLWISKVRGRWHSVPVAVAVLVTQIISNLGEN